MAAERIHADDTTLPVMAKGKTRTGRLAAMFFSPDRRGPHAERHLAGYAGLSAADAYAGFGRLYEANRKGGPIIKAAC
ncbi:hypothetical protein ABIB68_003697 [Bradyrhizobium sp. F1.2.2]